MYILRWISIIFLAIDKYSTVHFYCVFKHDSLFLLCGLCVVYIILYFLWQSYEINLQVTCVLAYLALIPHPDIDMYLLNPLVNLQPGANNLTTVLHKVATRIVHFLWFNIKNTIYCIKVIKYRNSTIAWIPWNSFDYPMDVIRFRLRI